MLLSEIVAGYMLNVPAGVVIAETDVERCLKNAVRFYAGFAVLEADPPADPEYHTPVDASDAITGNQDFDLNQSEYAIIYPLFKLYMERENASLLEASRGLGVDVYGRSVSEIAQDIAQKELDFPRICFVEEIVSV